MMTGSRSHLLAACQGGLTLKQALGGRSECRNKALAQAFRYMKLIEGWGSGPHASSAIRLHTISERQNSSIWAIRLG
ncbi:ATP-binding protein [Olsenella sp. Marseille-P4559]|uniref:ATP-binding protein n=1 Tax=Olsenella sp. Marseille-P4559 TaxID=2364795 RepID=UPI00352F3979